MDKNTALLERRTKYSHALNKSLELFVSCNEEAIDDVISSGLYPIADAAELDRIVVFRVFEQGTNSAGEVYRWDKTEGGATPIDPALRKLPINDPMERWISAMSDDKCVFLKHSMYSKDEDAFLTPRGVKAILIVPVFTEREFWGAVTFHEMRKERDFDEDCTAMLRSAAHLCAAAIIRDEKTRNAANVIRTLKRREEFINTLNKTAVFFLSQSDKPVEDTVSEGIKPILDMIDIDRFSVFRHIFSEENPRTSQIIRWVREEGGATQLNSRFQNISYTGYAPEWEKILKEGKSINGLARQMPENEARILKSTGVVSVFATPLFINEDLWGFALFEDLRRERIFDEDHTELMHSAALLCANTIIQSELRFEIKETEKLKLIREEDERIQVMFDSTPLACRLWDKDFNIIFCNNETVRLFNFKDKQDYLERHNLVSPEYQPDGQLSREKTLMIHEKVYAEGRYVFEWMHQSVIGELIPCEVTLVKVKFKGEDVIAGYTKDLREIKATTAKMREADARMQLIFNTAPIGCLMMDREFRIIDCNEEIIRMFGLPNSQLILNCFIDLSPEYQPDGRKSIEAAAELLKKAFNDGFNKFEWTHWNSNGELMPCEITNVRVKYKDDYVIAVYIRDLREQKNLLNKIHEENEKSNAMAHWYESLLDAIPFFVSAQDLNGICTFVNAAAESFLGIEWEEIVGLPCNRWAFPICDTENCAIECAKRGRMRTHFSHKNDSYQVDTKMLKDMNNNSIGYMEIIQDISKMEHMAKQQAEAEAASVAKSSFLSAMSHEMRTPMNAIIGMVSIGKNSEELERKNYALNKIEEASKHLLGVINDVLDMSKIEANKLELSHVSFDLTQSLKKAVSLVQFNMEEKNLKFIMNIADNTPSFLFGDDQRLTQVITNLLSNAVKFTPKDGDVSLDVSLADDTNGICEMRFEVADSGIGIDPQQHEKIFHPFEQAESGITRKFGGTGLGLVITKSIIELMNGKIWVVSNLGTGARFIFTVKLPRDEKYSGVHPAAASNESTLDETEGSFSGKRLLIAEDIEINREILISLLEGTGLIIETAENGKEAIDKITEDPERYDLVFMDMQMPVMDGLEATRKIREITCGREKRLPIIAMTANVFQEDIDKCREAGMDDHVGKPLDIANVFEKLREYL